MLYLIFENNKNEIKNKKTKKLYLYVFLFFLQHKKCLIIHYDTILWHFFNNNKKRAFKQSIYRFFTLLLLKTRI